MGRFAGERFSPRRVALSGNRSAWCGELLICVENQQFATHNLGTRPFKATRLPRSASEVFVSSFVFRLVFFVGCKKTRLKTPSFRCVLNWR
jgi:hypothetical protein